MHKIHYITFQQLKQQNNPANDNPFDSTTMPKVKKIRANALAGSTDRHEPLGQVIMDETNKKQYAAKSNRPSKKQDDTAVDSLLDEKSSKKIMELSKSQQLELEAEEHAIRRQSQQQQRKTNNNDDSDQDDDEDEQSNLEDDDDFIAHTDEGFVTISEGAMGLSPEDEALVAAMMNPATERKSLADIILEKIEQKDAEKRGEMIEEEDVPQLPPKVVEVYTDIGKILSRYTSGKLPKAFKVIPSLSNWEEVLYLTRPDQWTPQAMFAATRIFASNLNPKMAQRFYNLVLLDSVRADIQSNKKLNYHYYMALKKSVYKPAAFFKGILFPLCKDNCTLREAAIVASALQRVSIPVHHSAVAIHKLAQMKDYSGASSIFIKTLLNKKYSLPAPVIGSLVVHFAGFIDDSRVLPVLWHQALLVFVQRYKNEVQDEARESLRKVMKKHFHHKITPEIRRELFGLQAFKDERNMISEGSYNQMED